MYRPINLKRTVLAVGLALGLSVGVVVNSSDAQASTCYLCAPTLSTSSSSGGFPFSVNGTATMYASPTSSYGDTIPTPSAITLAGGPSTVATVSDNTTSTPAAPILYDPTGLFANPPVASLLSPFSITSSGATLSGDVLSQVFTVPTGTTYGNAVPGEVMVTYQFNITSGNTSAFGPTGSSVAYFNEFNNFPVSNTGTTWTLGAGINYTSGAFSFLGSTLPGKVVASQSITGEVYYGTDGSISSLQNTYNSGSAILLGEATPQFFVASNSLTWTTGNMSFIGFGSGGSGVAVLVPGTTPEPSTLILFASGLGLLAFMVLRKRQNQVVI